jgi:hypothetical protein
MILKGWRCSSSIKTTDEPTRLLAAGAAPPLHPSAPVAGVGCSLTSASPPLGSPPGSYSLVAPAAPSPPPGLQPGFFSDRLLPQLRHLLRRARARGTHPGELFVDTILEHLYAPVCTDLVPPASLTLRPAPLWVSVTPAMASSPLLVILDALYFWMGSGADHFRLRAVNPLIFRTNVSCPSVVALIVSLVRTSP